MKWFIGFIVISVWSLWGLPVYADGDLPRTNIAVLAFYNVSGDPACDWLSVGIAETLTVKLAQVPSFRLVERMRMKDLLGEQKIGDSGLVDAATAPKIGRLLGAQKLLLGAYQIQDDALRLSARLVDTTTGEVTTPVSVDGTIEEVFAVEDRLAAAILKNFGITLSPEIEAKIRVTQTVNPAAFQAYSSGLTYLYQGEFAKAAVALQLATDFDPQFQLALQTLRFAQWARPDLRTATYMTKVNAPYDAAYDAMLRALKHTVKLQSEDRAQGKLLASQGITLTSWGLKLQVELADFHGMTGLLIRSRTKIDMVNLGECQRCIRKIMAAFDEELRATNEKTTPAAQRPDGTGERTDHE
ncbi:MAG: Curli production assembly/transport component CsgG [bacterium ADurb.Bin429]|nr:MAG: Curli production assembly/transport component CsgG [bacterium ADurb.Bin429]